VGRIPRDRVPRRRRTPTSRAAIGGRWIATFPELHDALIEKLPAGCVVDGEIVIATAHGLDFRRAADAAPSGGIAGGEAGEGDASRFVAFDLLAAAGKDLRDVPQGERRARLEKLLGTVKPPSISRR